MPTDWVKHHVNCPDDHALGQPSDVAERRKMALLVMDGVSLLDIAAASESLASCADYELIVCSQGGAGVTTRSGLPFPVCCGAWEVGPVDTVIILGAETTVTDRSVPAQVAAARRLAGQARRLAAAGSGTLVLAATGAIAGRKVADVEQHAGLLRRLHPGADVVASSLVEDGNLITTSGADGAVRLAATIIAQDHGGTEHPAEDDTRSVLVANPTAARHPLVAELTLLIAADPAARHSLSELAGKAAVSPRHLSRLFRKILHTTPARYVEQVRFDTARSLLDQGTSVTDAAFMAGFGSVEAQRRVFIARLGVPPSAYRSRSAQPDRAARGRLKIAGARSPDALV